MTSDTEIFAQAAKAAEAKIPTVEKQIEDFRSQMDALQTELNHLRTIASYGKAKSPEKSVTAPAVNHPGIQKIVELLSLLGPMTAKQIKDSSAFGQSTIYSYLAQGRALGLFEQTTDDRWRIVEPSK